MFLFCSFGVKPASQLVHRHPAQNPARHAFASSKRPIPATRSNSRKSAVAVASGRLETRRCGGPVTTSGLVDVGEKDLPEGGRFLAKPYSPDELAGVLHDLIDARQI
jgi:hypothetical protein